MIVLRGGRVIDPASGTDGRKDVLIDDGQIVEVGDSLDGTEVIDCEGLVIAPGFVDLHVHFREPGGETSETIESGSRAAAAGGFTAVCPMPNTAPAQDNASVVEHVWRRGREVGLVDVFPMCDHTRPTRKEARADARDAQLVRESPHVLRRR
jgi:dihydroorotase